MSGGRTPGRPHSAPAVRPGRRGTPLSRFDQQTRGVTLESLRPRRAAPAPGRGRAHDAGAAPSGAPLLRCEQTLSTNRHACSSQTTEYSAGQPTSKIVRRRCIFRWVPSLPEVRSYSPSGEDKHTVVQRGGSFLFRDRLQCLLVHAGRYELCTISPSGVNHRHRAACAARSVVLGRKRLSASEITVAAQPRTQRTTRRATGDRYAEVNAKRKPEMGGMTSPSLRVLTCLWTQRSALGLSAFCGVEPCLRMGAIAEGF